MDSDENYPSESELYFPDEMTNVTMKKKISLQ